MHKMWLLFDPRRALIAAAVGVVLIAAVIHFVVLSSPRYADHLGWAPRPPLRCSRPVRPQRHGNGGQRPPDDGERRGDARRSSARIAVGFGGPLPDLNRRMKECPC